MRETTVDLAALSNGDRVAWLENTGYRNVLAVVATVERTTRTQFVVRADDGGLYRFNRQTGEMIGNGRWGPHLQDPLNGRVVNAVAAQRAREALRAIEALLGRMDRAQAKRKVVSDVRADQ
jgi:hypothetical protein